LYPWQQSSMVGAPLDVVVYSSTHSPQLSFPQQLSHQQHPFNTQ
jgi:hypothetical protein